MARIYAQPPGRPSRQLAGGAGAPPGADEDSVLSRGVVEVGVGREADQPQRWQHDRTRLRHRARTEGWKVRKGDSGGREGAEEGRGL